MALLVAEHQVLVLLLELLQLGAEGPLKHDLGRDLVVEALEEGVYAAHEEAVGRIAADVVAAGHEHVEGLLAPHVAHRLLAEQVELERLRAHRVDVQPRGDVAQLAARALGRRGERRGRGRAGRRAGRRLGLDELRDLGDDVQRDGLALADAAHAVRALREVPEHRVLAHGDHLGKADRFAWSLF